MIDEGQDALVVAFVMGADDDVVGVIFGGVGEFLGGFLIQDGAFWGREEDFGVRVFYLHGLDGGKKRLGAKKHAVAAAIRGIVDGFVGAEAEVAEIDKVKLGEAFVGGFPHHGSPKIGLQGVFKKRNQGEFNHIAIIS